MMTQNNQNKSPNSFDILDQIRGFHATEFKQINSLIMSIEKVEDEFRDRHDQCQNYLNEIQGKRRQNQKFGNISKGVLQGKSEEIKSKVKNIDSVSTGIKEVVSKVKVQKLTKLPVTQQRTLTKLFKTLYDTIYTEAIQFNWENFNKLALKHEGGEDFISRLVNCNFKDMSPQKYDKLMELKSDPQFQKISTKSIHGKDIIDLADWVDYICLGHKFSIEKKALEKQYERIRKDVDKKSKASLQVSENFWKEASQQIDSYHNQLRNISSELKSITFEMKKSAEQPEPTKPAMINQAKTQQIRA